MYGAGLLQKHYIVQREDVKGIMHELTNIDLATFPKSHTVILYILDDEGVETGSSSSASNSPIK